MDKNITVVGTRNGNQISIEVSKIIMGAADYFRLDNYEYVLKMLKLYTDKGINTFDTGRHYRHSDLVIGELIKRGDIMREEFVIFSKGCHPVREFPNTYRVNSIDIMKDIDESLERLNTDYIDMFALHRDDVSVDVSEIMDALNVAVKQGKVRAIGCSNWTTSRIVEANDYCSRNNKIGFTFNSANLSLATLNSQRWKGCVSIDEQMKTFHIETQLPNVAWSAQAEGFFAGRFNNPDTTGDEYKDVYYNDINWEKQKRANKLAVIKNTKPIIIALSYVLNQEFPCVAAIGPETLEQLKQSLEVLEVELTKSEVKYLSCENDEI